MSQLSQIENDSEKSVIRGEYNKLIKQSQKTIWQQVVAFVTNNFSVIVTGIISVVAVIVSYQQYRVANIQAELKQQEVKQAMANFVLTYREIVTKPDKSKQDYDNQKLLRAMMVKSFPPEVCNPVFEFLKDNADSPPTLDVWNEPALSSFTPTLTETNVTSKIIIYYPISEDPISQSIAKRLTDEGFLLKTGGIGVEGTVPGVVFYHQEDYETAVRIRKILQDYNGLFIERYRSQSGTMKNMPLIATNEFLTQPVLNQYKNIERGVFSVKLKPLSLN